MSEFDIIGLATGTVLQTHPPEKCAGQVCCIHNPSDHVMREFPLHWRSDRHLMERLCPHGVGHPDPDALAYRATFTNADDLWAIASHGCDGCCT